MQKNYCNYPVELTADAFGEASKLADTIRSVTGAERPRVQIVADYNVVQRSSGLGTKIGRYVQTHDLQLASGPMVLAGGEKLKSDGFQSALKVMSALLDARLGCSDLVLAIGGGSLLDVVGYAAAQVRGGLKLMRMPTTPAAMFDAAFAVRAGIDSSGVKDAALVNSVPAALVIDPGFATTVLDGVWFGGMTEVVRLALTRDAALFKLAVATVADYRSRKPETLTELIRAVVGVRQKKPATDLAEWVALRLEAMSGYKLPHGHAVTLGILVELAYAVEVGMLKAKDRETALRLLGDGGALEGLRHFQYLFNQPEMVLHGLDAWELRRGKEARELPAGIGKCKPESEPRREVYTNILNFDKILGI